MALAFRLLFFLCVAALGTESALPAENIGATRTVVNRVSGEVEALRRILSVGDPVHLDETIRTERQSSTQIILKDRSSLSLGPNTELVLDEFVYRPGRSTGQIVIGAARGALRFISGEASKNSYRINMPMATVGIRGTDLDTYSDRHETSMVLLRRGLIRFCRAFVIDIWAPTPNCIDLVAPLTWALVNRRGIIGPFPWDGTRISDILFANRPGQVRRQSPNDDPFVPSNEQQQPEDESIDDDDEDGGSPVN